MVLSSVQNNPTHPLVCTRNQQAHLATERQFQFQLWGNLRPIPARHKTVGRNIKKHRNITSKSPVQNVTALSSKAEPQFSTPGERPVTIKSPEEGARRNGRTGHQDGRREFQFSVLGIRITSSKSIQAPRCARNAVCVSVWEAMSCFQSG